MKPLRILQVVTYMGRGGLETMLMNYYRYIDREKVQFDFLVHREFEADYDCEIKKLGGKIYRVSRLVPWSRRYKQELRIFFKNHPEYKIIHVHQDCLSSIALKMAEECGISVRIGHSHNTSADKNIKYLIKRYYMKQIPKYATELFSCGEAAGDWMFQGCRYHVLPNAIDTELYSYNERTEDKVRKEFHLKNELLIGHVGRFFPQKNHRFLIEIFAEVLKKNPSAKLLLVGDGDEKETILKKTELMNISQNIIFAGVRSDVNELMQAMNVFVFPSLYEGIPVTLIEAQASGIPCVISDKVSDECIVTGGLVTKMKLSNSAKEWADCVLEQSRLISKRERKEDYRKQLETSGYDIATAAKRLEKFYLSSVEE